MKYTEKLLKHPEFQKIQEEITESEQDRIYCRHEISHALDVCRIAWIMYLETYVFHKKDGDSPEKLSSVKDQIYVAGLLHDIGRARQYATGEHHAAAGKRIADRILTDIDYPVEWKETALNIITEHHGRRENNVCYKTDMAEGLPFDEIQENIAVFIRHADHLSRNCFCCASADSCKWKEEERNRTILF